LDLSPITEQQSSKARSTQKWITEAGKKMSTELWPSTVEVTIDSGDHFKSVSNSREALACLMTCWPSRGGKAFAIARRACIGAMDGRVEASVAAEAFKTAALEAGLLRQ
jgi:hypothetical protein